MGANDGMMHAFNATTGVESWAYVPSMVIPDLWRLADNLYSDNHRNYVNGSPITSDVCTANCANAYNAATPSTNPVWKTILVAGLNGGGRGYFALDITNPASPTLLWEFTTSAGIGKIKDDDLGYTYGQPVITRKADGTWVVLVASGYDNGTSSGIKSGGSFVANSPAGSGKGFLYVLNAGTGAIISKISTGVGTAAAPSGLAKIAGYNTEPSGNKVSYVYGGDLLGNLWRFDINSSTPAAIGTGTAFKFATLFSDTPGTLPQPVTTTPILGTILGKRIVYIGTGQYLGVPDLTTANVQTQYAIKDDDATATLVNPRAPTNGLVQQFLINNPDGSATRLSAKSATATTSGANTVDFSMNRGWFVDFPVSRERVNIDAKLVLGTLVVPSIVPSSTECSPGGSGWLNFFDYKTGGAVNVLTGLTSVKYDATIVGINVLFISGQPIVEVVTSNDPTPAKDPNVQFAATATNFQGKRVLWRELIP
jgi:type IV pilus assembly protein PilY1